MALSFLYGQINYEKMTTVARLVHQMSWNLSEQDRRPSLDRLGVGDDR